MNNSYMRRKIFNPLSHTIKRASYTIEASILIPLFLFIMAMAMKSGLQMYEEMQTYEIKNDFSAVDVFIRRDLIGL